MADTTREMTEKQQETDSKLQETNVRLEEMEEQLRHKQAEVSTYQDMLEQSQGQYIILEKKYYKAKKIIKGKSKQNKRQSAWSIRWRHRLLGAFESRRHPQCFLSGTLW